MSARVRSAIAAFIAVVVSLTMVGLAAPASADTTVALPWSSFAHVLADAHGHVYVTGGPGADGVFVRNADGSASTTITGEAGASGMVLSADGATLYVALRNAAAIAAIDTTSLTETSRISAVGHCPDSVAVVGTNLWFADGCAANGALGTVPLSGGTPAYTTETFYQPLLLAVPGDPAGLLVGQRGVSPATINRFTVAGTTLTTVATRSGIESNLGSMAIDPDGTHLVLAAGAPYQHNKAKLSDLSTDASYTSNTYPNAVAASSGLGGVVAAGVNGIYWDDVYVYRAGTFVRSYDFPTNDELVADGLAWSPDGVRLYAVTSSFHLHVLDGAAKASVTLTIAGTSSTAPGGAVTLTGSLTDGAGALSGVTLGVSRTDGQGTTALAGAVTAADGSYSVSDTAGSSTATYTVSYLGDTDRQAAQAVRQVTVVKPASSLTVVGPGAAKRGVAFTLSGTLSNGGSPVAGAHLVIMRKDLAGTRTLSAVTAASGAWSLKDTPAVGGTVTFTASWAGDATRAAVSASRNVAVARTATAMSIKVSKSLYTYRARAVITVHLGTTYNGRTVTVFARPYGASAATRIATARVNSAGNVVVASLISRRTTYSAVFAGDYRYAPVSHSVTPNVVSSVVITPASYSSRSGTTYRYHGKDPLFRVVVQPGRAYGCISMQVQYSRSSRWVAGVSLTCGTLDSTSTDYIIFRSNRPAGVKFRVRAYVGASSFSAAGSSPWTYFVFV